jgi:hypothetical protein
MAQINQRAVVVRGFVRMALQIGDQPGVVGRVGFRLTGIARRKNTGRTTEGGNTDAGIIGQRRQATCARGMTRFG